MSLKSSLRTQILSLLGGSLLLVLLVALACFNFLSGSIGAYQRLLDGPVHSAQLVDQANVALKVQVQEWKNLLQSITGAVETIRDMNRQIATAAEEQTAVVEDISRHLVAITTGATNEENVQRTQGASRHLHALSGELAEVTHRLQA